MAIMVYWTYIILNMDNGKISIHVQVRYLSDINSDNEIEAYVYYVK